MTAGCLGSGYLLYKLYNSHTRRLADLQRQLANDREHDENIKAQLSFLTNLKHTVGFVLTDLTVFD